MNEKIQLSLLALLKKLEWSGHGRRYDYGEFASVCPICTGSKPLGDEDDTERGAGHRPACELVALMQALQEV